MNNTNYATLVSNATNCKSYSHFEINFINECVLNDNIIVKAIDNEYIIGYVLDKVSFVAYIK